MHYYKGTCSVLVGSKETISICGLSLQRGLLSPGGSNEVEMDVYQDSGLYSNNMGLIRRGEGEGGREGEWRGREW